MDANGLWQRYQDLLCDCGELGITLDVSRVPFGDDFMQGMEGPMHKAYDAMAALEAGGIANLDENRMVGHYWLRDAKLAPDDDTAKVITKTLKAIKQFAKKVHEGKTAPPKAKKFTDILQVGIGGSALGPQLVADWLGTSKDKMRVHFMDNTDPDGIGRTLTTLRARLKSTLV
ncbi:MAG: glucose-6-phosphate isomerase, partial [Planctomycetota bacterium]